MRVRMEETTLENHGCKRIRQGLQESPSEFLGELGVRAHTDAALLKLCPQLRERHARHVVHAQDTPRHKAGDALRHKDWRPAPVPAEQARNAVHGRSLALEVKLLAQLLLELAEDDVVIYREDASQLGRHVFDDSNVAHQLLLNLRPLDLHSDLSSAPQPRAVHLRDGGAAQRPLLEALEDLLQGVATQQLLLDHTPHEGEG
mmetsp:Transcript_71203/g.212380  ORF Transcript_71203/g.212380 Transcript_71203/m.212380 type:complete len:202 (-) Transcript_71203:511-1116(-)